jgi:hypothetical protein
MRVNVYFEELGREDGRVCEVVMKESANGQFFWGLRTWLRSPAEILAHNTTEDDDSSAVTVWFTNGEQLHDYVRRVALAARDWGTGGIAKAG